MSDFIIEDFAPVAAPNPYTDAVQALINAGPGKSLSIIVPRGHKRLTEEQKAAGQTEGDPGDGGADRLKFQQAANAAGVTARIRNTEDAGDGNVKLTFTLTEKHKRGPKSETAETPADQPSESAEEQVESDESDAGTSEESDGETEGRRRRR